MIQLVQLRVTLVYPDENPFLVIPTVIRLLQLDRIVLSFGTLIENTVPVRSISINDGQLRNEDTASHLVPTALELVL